jgi:hypothetical protein
MTNATAATIGDSQGIGTIENDDTATISINDVSLAEGDSGSKAFQFTVSIDKAANRDITVVANTQGVTAAGGGADFANLTNQLVTIAAGTTSKTVAVNVAGETLMEFDETFQVNLTDARFNGGTDASRVTIGDAQGIGTIQNDDTATITINDVLLAEGNSSMTAFTFTVSIDHAANKDITVLANTLGATAVGGGADFANLTNQLVTIAAGTTSKTVTVNVTGETLVEDDETFAVNLSDAKFDGVTDATLVTIGDSQGIGTIDNDDTATISIDDVSLAEGDSGITAFEFTVSIDKTANRDITVVANTAVVTAGVGGADFVNLSNQLVTISAGTTSKTVAVNVTGETLVESDETFHVNLTKAKFNSVTDATRATIGDSQGIGTIENDDTVTISIDDVSLAEGDSGTTAFQFTVSIDKAANSDVTVLANTLGVTATGGGVDYADLTNQLVTIAAGTTSKTVTVNVTGELDAEGDETFQVNLTDATFNGVADATGAVIGDPQGIGTIVDETTDDSGSTTGGTPDPLAQAAYDLDQSLGLVANATYNWGGANEKWIGSASGSWYFLTADGKLYEWTGASPGAGFVSGSELVAMFDTTFYVDPTKLTDAPVPDAGGSGEETGDGGETGGGEVDPLAQAAYDLDQSMGLVANATYNWGGANEKWVGSTSGMWYFLTEDGSLYKWTGASPGAGFVSGSELVATFDGSYYLDPTKLTDAPVPTAGSGGEEEETGEADPLAQVAYDLDQDLGLIGNSTYNWGGANEKWLGSTSGAWYFLTEDGSLYKWIGSSPGAGFVSGSQLVATLDATYYADPSKLFDALDAVFSDPDGLLG